MYVVMCFNSIAFLRVLCNLHSSPNSSGMYIDYEINGALDLFIIVIESNTITIK